MAPRKRKSRLSHVKNSKTSKKSKVDSDETSSKGLNLLELPNEMLLKIFDYLPCHQVAKIRVLGHRMNEICASTLLKKFKVLEVDLLQFLTDVRIHLLQFDFMIWGAELRQYKMYSKVDSIIIKVLDQCKLLKKTIGLYAEKQNYVFFPGKIIDTCYDIMNTLKVHLKEGDDYEQVPYCCSWTDAVDISNLERLVVKALKYFDVSVKAKRFNLRTTTINQMQKRETTKVTFDPLLYLQRAFLNEIFNMLIQLAE